MASVSSSSMRHAWQSAILKHENRFTPEDLAEIKKTTKPDDLLGFIKTLDVRDDKSNVSQIARRIGMLGSYFNTYEHSLDMITQGLPSPGCLIWGSIKLVLSVSGFLRILISLSLRLLFALEAVVCISSRSTITSSHFMC